MFVPISVIMDCLAEWEPTLNSTLIEKSDLKFKDVRIVYNEQTEFDPNILYILRDNMFSANSVEGLSFICLRDVPAMLKGKCNFIILNYCGLPEQLCAKISYCISSIMDWENKLNLAIIKGCTEQDLLNMSDTLIKNPVIIQDTIFCCLASSESITEEDVYYYDLKIHGNPTLETIKALAKKNRESKNYFFGHFDSGQEYRIGPGPTKSKEIYVDLKINDTLIMALNMRFSRHPLTDGLIAILGVFVEKLRNLCLLRGKNEQNTGAISLNEYLFPRLIRGEEEAWVFAQKIGLFKGHYIIATTDTKEIRVLSKYAVETISGSCVFFNEQRMFIFIPIDLLDQTSSYYISRQEERLRQLGERLPVVMGLSGPFNDGKMIGAACLQSKKALELYRQSHSSLPDRGPGDDVISKYRDVALIDMISCYREKYPLNSYAPLSYINMREKDVKCGTDYCSFVKTYILNGCSVAKTAQNFNLHKNSVIYRLEKIYSTYGLDFSDMYENQLYVIACIVDEIGSSTK